MQTTTETMAVSPTQDVSMNVKDSGYYTPRERIGPEGTPLESLNPYFYGLNTGPQRITAYIDGWSMDKMSYQERCNVLYNTNLNTKSLKDKASQISRGEIGILPFNCEVKWYKVHQIGHIIGWDFARILSKGARYRIRLQRIKFSGLNDEDKVILKALSKERSKGKNSCESLTYLANTCRNYEYKGLLGIKVRALKEKGWIIRKEDKGNRLVITTKSWEAKQFAEYSSTLERVEKEIRFKTEDEFVRIPRVYFLPKCHKQQVTGRPLVSYAGIAQEYVKEISRACKRYIKKFNPRMDETRVEDAILTVAPRHIDDVVITGDIKSLFTEIDREELMEFLASELEEVYHPVWLHLTNSVLSYGDFVYRMNDGIDMGSSISPLLARAYLTWKEREFVERYKKEIRFSRYVDDVSFTLKFKSMEQIARVKYHYECAIGPKLKVEWKEFDMERAEVLDAKFEPDALYIESDEPVAWLWKMSFNDQDRKSSLANQGDIARSTMLNAFVEELRRRKERNKYFLEKVPDILRSPQVEYSEIFGNIDKDKGYNIPRSTRWDFVSFMRQTFDTDHARRLAQEVLLSDRIKKKTKDYVVQIHFNPLYETKKGNKVLKRCIEAWKKKLKSDSIRIDFINTSKKLYDCIMLKTRKSYIRKVTDDGNWGIPETVKGSSKD